jgi:hypothetical protein
MVMASSGHSSTQVPQLTHSSRLTTAGIIKSSNLPHTANIPVSISDIYLSLAKALHLKSILNPKSETYTYCHVSAPKIRLKGHFRRKGCFAQIISI